jgi:hypothetical protein
MSTSSAAAAAAAAGCAGNIVGMTFDHGECHVMEHYVQKAGDEVHVSKAGKPGKASEAGQREGLGGGGGKVGGHKVNEAGLGGTDKHVSDQDLKVVGGSAGYTL